MAHPGHHAEHQPDGVALIDAGPDVASDDHLADALLRHCREHLAGFKCPRAIHFDTVP